MKVLPAMWTKGLLRMSTRKRHSPEQVPGTVQAREPRSSITSLTLSPYPYWSPNRRRRLVLQPPKPPRIGTRFADLTKKVRRRRNERDDQSAVRCERKGPNE